MILSKIAILIFLQLCLCEIYNLYFLSSFEKSKGLTKIKEKRPDRRILNPNHLILNDKQTILKQKAEDNILRKNQQ